MQVLHDDYIFKPVRMPRPIYDQVQAFPTPMPILKPADVSEISTDLHYLISFQEAHILPLTNKHQSSLASVALRVVDREKKKVASRQIPTSEVAQDPIITKLKNKSNFKIGVATKVRGVVKGKNCHKPRCIFSQSAISEMQLPLLPRSLEKTPSEPPTPHQMHEYRAMFKDKLHDAM
jgi:hypothetical protein